MRYVGLWDYCGWTSHVKYRVGQTFRQVFFFLSENKVGLSTKIYNSRWRQRASKAFPDRNKQ